jgi:MauM/NapG family ferredoxin protein
MGKNLWKQLRRACQILSLILFCVLFRLTDYTGADTIPYAVNIFFRIDPLVGVCVTLATKTLVSLLWPCLVLVGLTLVLGRFFCGWICPLGTLISMAGHGITPVVRSGRKPGSVSNLRFLKYGLLVIVLISSFFSIQLLGFVDPFALLVRGMAFGVDPVFNFLVTGVFDTIYLSGPAWLSDLTEPFYGILKSFVLPYKQGFFYLSALSFLLLAGILVLEIFDKRFWCKNICPLGALLGIISKISIFKRISLKSCKGCNLCEKKCPMDAFKVDAFKKDAIKSDAIKREALKSDLMVEECTFCMDCLEYCPRGSAGFGFGLPAKPKPLDISRRKILTAGVAGICLPLLSRTHPNLKLGENDVIRPPGALDEADFLATCVRCGECMKVCITNGLQPIGFEKGIEKMFTPRLVPRLGYCEFNCTLCSQVCPTNAIELLAMEKKHAFVMGKAWFDKNRCLPYAENRSCIVCEEHCPVHDKAIQFDEVMVTGDKGNRFLIKRPRILSDRCIGCGICEHVCPVPGKAAVLVMGLGSGENSSTGSGYS